MVSIVLPGQPISIEYLSQMNFTVHITTITVVRCIVEEWDRNAKRNVWRQSNKICRTRTLSAIQ